MKKINSEFQMNGAKTFIELFNYLLENSDYNLNQFVRGDTLAITDDVQEDFVSALKRFMDIAPETVKNIEDKEGFWRSFEQLDDYKNNNKFIKWLARYADAAIRPFEDAAFLREMEDVDFEKMTNYCFQNFVIKDIGRKRIGTEWDTKQISKFRKIMLTFIEMVITDNYSKENTFANMQRLFGIRESQCELWWNIVEQNEEKLWRIMLMKQYNRIENKINAILEQLEEKESIKTYM